jgi:hypothetical protein
MTAKNEMQSVESWVRMCARRHGYRLERLRPKVYAPTRDDAGYYRLLCLDDGHEVDGSSRMTLRQIEDFAAERGLWQELRDTLVKLVECRASLRHEQFGRTAEEIAAFEAEVLPDLVAAQEAEDRETAEWSLRNELEQLTRMMRSDDE